MDAVDKSGVIGDTNRLRPTRRLAPSPLRTVGQIQTPWPQFAVPTVSWSALSELLGLAFALTIVALAKPAVRSRPRADRLQFGTATLGSTTTCGWLM